MGKTIAVFHMGDGRVLQRQRGDGRAPVVEERREGVGQRPVVRRLGRAAEIGRAAAAARQPRVVAAIALGDNYCGKFERLDYLSNKEQDDRRQRNIIMENYDDGKTCGYF
ncbi:hypothetical protein BconGalA64_08810 [Burkholderia contaminans]|uniref:hypothetical protein n=1 Tax=Burkholderia contaminans TaxID=488447 RepID=UPI00308C7C89|nr:hypothetical protein BconGalA64_08810 [Burkholderia contaminans]